MLRLSQFLYLGRKYNLEIPPETVISGRGVHDDCEVYRSCHPNITRFVYKPRRFEEKFHYTYFYGDYLENRMIRGILQRIIHTKLHALSWSCNLNFDVFEVRNFNLDNLILTAEMNRTTLEKFEQQVIINCKENIIKLTNPTPSAFSVSVILLNHHWITFLLECI